MAGVAIDLRDAGGGSVRLRLRNFRSNVRYWIGDVCHGVFAWDALWQWPVRPATALSYDGITWVRTHHGAVAVVMDGVVPRWPLIDHVLDGCARAIERRVKARNTVRRELIC